MPGKLLKQIGKLLKKKPKSNPNLIDGRDVTQTRFRGTNRQGEQVVKTGTGGKEYDSYLGQLNKLKKLRLKKQNKKQFGGATGPNGIL